MAEDSPARPLPEGDDADTGKRGSVNTDGSRGADESFVFTPDMDPDRLPPYKDPEGRQVTARHRRRALRKAKNLGLNPKHERHALHLLAHEGIDIVGNDDSLLDHAKRSGNDAASNAGSALMIAETQDLVGTDDDSSGGPVPNATKDEDQAREAAIREIQHNLVRRRRRRFAALLFRLAVVVVLPTILVGYYYFKIATPMYATESKFVIQTSDNPAAGGGIGGLLAGTGFATSQDSIVVQNYLQSREAFLRLERDFGYSAHFQNPEIDILQRLPEDASLDKAFNHFIDRVTIGYDPSEGVIRMEVVAATPQESQQFSEALISYAEERVDGLTREARGDQLQDAVSRYEESEEAMLDAQQRVLTLQQQRGILSAEVELSSQMSIINSLQLQAEERRLALAEISDNAQEGSSRARLLEDEIRRLDDRVAQLRSELTQNSESTVSLARVSAELRIAESELATRQLILQESIGAMETARLEANRQVRYLSLGVAPVAPVEATYPRKVEGTALAFVVFMAIYIMISLTVSILREQVSV